MKESVGLKSIMYVTDISNLMEKIQIKFHNFFGPIIFWAKSPLIKKLISDGSNIFFASIEACFKSNRLYKI